MDLNELWHIVYKHGESGLLGSTVDEVLSIIEKQISKKPIKDNTNFQKCIVCDELVNSDMHYYCPVCGNKIDWSKD